MAYDYESDPDISILKNYIPVGSEANIVAPKKSTMSGKNPNLQYHDYENDPDLAVLNTFKTKEPAKTTEVPSQYNQMFNSLLRKAAGGYEAGLSLASGAVLPVVAGVKGIAQSIPEAISTGQAPQPIAERIASQFLKTHPSYQPQTKEGQDYLGYLQEKAQDLNLPPLPELMGTAPAVGPASQQLFSQFKNLPNVATKAVKNKVGTVRIEPVSGLQSGGAAATEHATKVEAALADASPELQAVTRNIPLEEINLPALETRKLEEKHGVNLSAGQRTNDTGRYAEEWNNRSKHQDTLGEHFNNQPKQFSEAFDNLLDKHAPNITDRTPSGIGQAEIDGLVAKDNQRLSAIKDAYKKLEDANAGQFPIDVTKLKENIDTALKAKLKKNAYEDHLSSIKRDIDDLVKSGSMTFEDYENLRSNLASEMRDNTKGTARAAAHIIRDQLENLPLPDNLQNIKPLADQARALYAERMNVIKNNPAYKAAVKEAVTPEEAEKGMESLNAAKFHDKFVTNGTPEAVRRLIDEVGQDSLAHEAVKAGHILSAKEKAGFIGESKNFTPATLNKFLDKQKEKLFDIHGPEGSQDLAEINALGAKVSQPKTGVFNHSNTLSGYLGQAAQNVGESYLAAKTGGASVPFVQFAKEKMKQVRSGATAEKSINPYTGLSIKDSQ